MKRNFKRFFAPILSLVLVVGTFSPVAASVQDMDYDAFGVYEYNDSTAYENEMPFVEDLLNEPELAADFRLELTKDFDDINMDNSDRASEEGFWEVVELSRQDENSYLYNTITGEMINYVFQFDENGDGNRTKENLCQTREKRYNKGYTVFPVK